MTNIERENKIAKYTKLFDCTREEAIKIIEDDELIDKGGRADWEPSIEEEKAMRKVTKLKVERKKTERKPREKVVNDEKVNIINTVYAALLGSAEEITISNAEKTIDFVINGASYSINLTKHRK